MMGVCKLFDIINIVLIFFKYKTAYHITNRTALIHAATFYAIWMLVEAAAYNLLCLTAIRTYPYFLVLYSTASKIVMYLSVHMINRRRKLVLFINVPFYYWIRLFLIPIGTIYLIRNIYYPVLASDSIKLGVMIAILMILLNYIAIDIVDRLGKLLENEKKSFIYKQQIILCNKQASEREAAYQETRYVRHDLNNYLVDLHTMLQSGRVGEAELKIEEMLKLNRIYRNEISSSGNLVIDSLINYKYMLAQKEKITMKCYIDIAEILPFDGVDLCVILGNLIDNAIEAVSNLALCHRCIDVIISQIKGSISIVIRNPYHGQVSKSSSGEILTHKKECKDHGIGLESVRYALSKYDGELLIDYNQNIFKATALLYSPES